MSKNLDDKVNSISVVLCTYAGECADNLDAAIKSMLVQSRVPDELLVVLDGEVQQAQHDVINRYAEKYPQVVRTVRSSKNIGRGAIRNLGVDSAEGNFVAIMDSDDLSLPERLDKQEKLFDSTDVDIVVGWQTEFRQQPSNIVATKRCPPTHDAIKKSLKFRCLVPNPSVMIKKEIFQVVGGYGEFRNINEDHDLFIKLSLHGATFGVVNEPLINVRISDEQRKRRSGVALLRDDLRFRLSLYRRGYYNVLEMLAYSALISIFRVVPWRLKGLIYKLIRD